MADKDIILEVRDLKKYFKSPTGTLHAVDGVNFSIRRGETLGLVGESGCGKSTIGRLILGLHQSTSGEILFNGQDICKMNKKQLHDLRKDLQIIFQDPFSSLNPRMSIGEIIGEPLRIHAKAQSRAELDKEVSRLMDVVGLSARLFNAYPHELDGGRRQRVGIARAFAANPPIVLMDEPFSALDPMTRAELQNEIHDLQTKAQKTVVFVTHDMDEAIKLADRICIIQDGKVAQCDTPENILKHPANQYVTEFIGANRLWANPEYIRAADIMRRRPFTISKGRTVIQALQIMRHNSVDSLLVLDKGQTLLGVVWLEELIGKREADPIEYYISDDYIAVEGETSLKEIIATIDYDVSGIIPVIQHDRKLLGYLTKSIILATMSKQFVPEHTAGERSGVICPATL